jgi:hypothetical protein
MVLRVMDNLSRGSNQGLGVARVCANYMWLMCNSPPSATDLARWCFRFLVWGRRCLSVVVESIPDESFHIASTWTVLSQRCMLGCK